MAEAVDGCDAPGLRPGDRRTKREIEIDEWWSAYRAISTGGTRGLEVRDKVDGSNRYGVIPWEVPLRDQGPSPVSELVIPEAVSDGYTYQRVGTRRQRDGRTRANRARKGPVV